MENLRKGVLSAEIERKLTGIIPKDRIHCFDFPRPSKNVIERYLQMEVNDLTPTLSDILDARGILGAIPASILQPIIPGKRIAGPAVTLRHIPERKVPVQKLIDKEKPKHQGTRDHALVAKPGDVLVVEGSGRMDISSQGYLKALSSKLNGFAGTILDCGTRDVGAVRKLDYPTWARGVTPITGKHRFEAYEVNVPVICAGIVIYPGDLVVADDSGVAIVPSSLIGEVLEDLEKIREEEKELERAIRNKEVIV